MATVSDNWHSELCAEHDGSIASFKRLSLQLKDLTEYEAVFKRDSINLKTVGHVVGLAGAAAAVMVPASLLAAPAIGGALGAFMGLSGAAATSAGLAAIGGGSIAAGGAGMAGGVAVIAATGGSLGATLGGVVSNSYFGDISGFAIEKLLPGKEPAVLVIDGFLTEAVKRPDDWINAVAKAYPGHACYYIRWESQRLLSIGRMVLQQIVPGAGAFRTLGMAARASRVALGKMSPAVSGLQLIQLANNPWHTAMVKAQQTGVLLADLISRTQGQYILCGHSLGARVINYALRTLATREGPPKVLRAHLLGGAVGSRFANWEKACKAVEGGIVNYHSSNDQVLQYAYSVGTGFQSAPIGRNPIVDLDHAVQNVDVSSAVDGHTKYKGVFHDFVVS